MKDSTLGQRIGQRVTELRDEKGWSQRQLARETGMSVSTVSRVEGGKLHNRPDPRTIRDLARALGVSPEDLEDASRG